MNDQTRLSCGCLGTCCDSRNHDTAPDWDGKPSGPGRDDEIERIAKLIIRLTNCIPTPTINASIRGAAVELAELILGEEA